MPDLVEHMYCAQQINIPPNLPFILKQYAKAAIRTQPHDLLYWSAAYFRAKANNTPPPVKERLEYPPVITPSRLSPGFLKVLHKQLGDNEFVAVGILYEKWLGVCLVKEALDAMLKIGNLPSDIPWLKFVTIAAGHLCPSLNKTMIMICEVLTEEPDGGSAMIPVDIFVTLYQFLARMDCGPEPPFVPPPVESTGTITPTSTEAFTLVDTKRGSSITKDTAVSEKDSNAGLMVWDDVKPAKIEYKVESPKYTDELGASSELGIEVLDDAKGPVTEVITLFPVQPHVESDVKIPSLSTTSDLRGPKKDDESVLSHTSLQENANWIQINIRKEEDEFLKQEASGLLSTPMITENSSEADDSEQTQQATHEPTEVPPEVEEIADSELQEKTKGDIQSPTKDHGSPIKVEPESPKNVHESPKNDLEFPEKDHESPENDDDKKDHESPKKDHESPKKDHESPEKVEGGSPKRVEDFFPEKDHEFPKNVEGESPQKVDGEPPKKVQDESPKKVDDKTVQQSSTGQVEAKKELSIKHVMSEDKKVVIKSSPEEVQGDIRVDSNIGGTQPSEDSLIEPGEKITKRDFINNIDDTVPESVVEIRKGYFGDNSTDVIDRSSSENTVKASLTVHRVDGVQDESSEFIFQEKDAISREGERSSGEYESPQDSESFIVLPPEEPWQHIPGIGPVIPEPQILAVVEYMQYWAAKQHGMVMPRNINHILCPPLDLPPPCESDDHSHY